MAQKCFLKANEKICVKSVRQILSRCPLCPPFWPRPLLADVLKCLSRPIQEMCVSEVCGAQQRSNGSWRRCQIVAQVPIECVCVCVKAPHKLLLQGQFKCKGGGSGRRGCGDLLVEHIRNKH